jgi:hypothetical protein
MAAKLTSDTTALSGRELYHLQLSLQADSPETFEHTLVATGNCFVGTINNEMEVYIYGSIIFIAEEL